jgi:hypothetical protein
MVVRWSLCLLVAVAVLATGCAGGGGDDSAQGPTTTAMSPQDRPEPAGDDEPLDRYAGYESDVYVDTGNWVCHPAVEDICERDIGVTVVEEDGTLTTEPWEPADDPAIDCFYVYPTISQDPGPLSDMDASDDEEGYAALNQVALLGEHCRVFAPVYRQRTLAALAAGFAGRGGTDDEANREVPFEDVTDAWRHYMSNENGGRGVVLIGHSQGAGLLNRLIASEIDPNDDVGDVLVAAYLAGSGVTVPEGADVGGAFQNVPLCREEDQTGCVVTWAAYRSTAPPPPDALFGRPRQGDGVVACNSPASLDGGSVELDSRFPASVSASILGGVTNGEEDASGWVDPPGEPIETPFVATPGLVSGGCVERDGFNYLEVEVTPGPGPRVDDIGGDLTPQWGLHLADVSLVMGDISRLVRSQSQAWLEGR